MAGSGSPATLGGCGNVPWREMTPIEVADAQHLLDVTEDAGPNRDHWGRIASYLAACGILTPAPWCAAFAYRCHLEAGVAASRLVAGRLAASTYEWAKWAALLGRLRTFAQGLPKRGDLFLWNSSLVEGRVGPSPGSGHIGFVCEARRDRGRLLRTIEGNSNADGSRNGNALIRRGSRSGVPGQASLTPNTTETWRVAGADVHWISMEGIGR